MNARVYVTLKDDSPENAQKTLEALLSRMKSEGMIEQFRFDIETAAGVVTEKCIFTEGIVVA